MCIRIYSKYFREFLFYLQICYPQGRTYSMVMSNVKNIPWGILGIFVGYCELLLVFYILTNVV